MNQQKQNQHKMKTLTNCRSCVFSCRVVWVDAGKPNGRRTSSPWWNWSCCLESQRWSVLIRARIRRPWMIGYARCENQTSRRETRIENARLSRVPHLLRRAVARPIEPVWIRGPILPRLTRRARRRLLRPCLVRPSRPFRIGRIAHVGRIVPRTGGRGRIFSGLWGPTRVVANCPLVPIITRIVFIWKRCRWIIPWHVRRNVGCRDVVGDNPWNRRICSVVGCRRVVVRLERTPGRIRPARRCCGIPSIINSGGRLTNTCEISRQVNSCWLVAWNDNCWKFRRDWGWR